MDDCHRQTGQPLWVQDELRRRGQARAGEFSSVRTPLDRTTLLGLLKACGRQKDLLKGSRIHAAILKSDLLKRDVCIGTALLRMYAKCGVLAKAQEVFDELPVRDVVAWTALITGYAQHGLGQEALNCFRRMQDEGLSPVTITFACILKACGSIGAVEKGEEIYAEICRRGLLDNRDIVLGTALVDMYAKCGMLAKAQQVFDGLPVRNVVSWTALIAGYVQHGHADEALNCYERMQDEGVSPDAVTFGCLLKACGSIGAIEKGEEIHAEVHRLGLLGRYGIVLGTALLDMYAKCGALEKAREVFDEIPVRDAVSWTALIAGYAQHGLGEEALNCFVQMQDDGFCLDVITFACVLKACGSIGATEKGKKIHAEVCKLGLLKSHAVVLGNALVDMYAKCGMVGKAQEVFDELPVLDVVSWNALIAGYAQHGLGEEALNCFAKMQDEGFPLDAFTFSCILKVCGSIGAIQKGEEIHVEVCRLGLLENHDLVLGNALVDMYAQCGRLAKAQEVFDGLPVRNAVSWTALMAGYAQLGKAKIVFNLFSKMRGECLEPDGVTFTVLLTACSHAGLVQEGQMYYDIMSTVYCIIPSSEHQTCMVDLFSRAGYFDKAISVIVKVQDSSLWLALLCACQEWVNVDLGRWAFQHALHLDMSMITMHAAVECKEKLQD